MRTVRRVYATFGIDTTKVPETLTCATGMYKGMGKDPATYIAANPPLPAFLVMINNLADAQQVVTTRVKGAAATRDMHHALLLGAMETERAYVQTLADSSLLNAEALIVNAGLVVGARPSRIKPIIVLRQGKQSGTINCDANVGLLLGAGTPKPTQSRFFNWQYTLDGKTFINLPSTTTGKTIIQGLTPLTTVGVRVNVNLFDGPGEWSQVVTILVH